MELTYINLIFTATYQPFGLHVKTDGDEPLATETGNFGFSLDYTMQSTGC